MFITDCCTYGSCHGLSTDNLNNGMQQVVMESGNGGGGGGDDDVDDHRVISRAKADHVDNGWSQRLYQHPPFSVLSQNNERKSFLPAAEQACIYQDTLVGRPPNDMDKSSTVCESSSGTNNNNLVLNFRDLSRTGSKDPPSLLGKQDHNHTNSKQGCFKVIPCCWTKGNPPVLPFVHAGAKSCGNSIVPLRCMNKPDETKSADCGSSITTRQASCSQMTQADVCQAQEKGELITDRTAATILFQLSNKGDKKKSCPPPPPKIKNSKPMNEASSGPNKAKVQQRRRQKIGVNKKSSHQLPCLYLNGQQRPEGVKENKVDRVSSGMESLSGPGSGAGGLRIAGVSRPNGYPIHDSEYDQLPDYTDRLPYMTSLPAIHWAGPPMEIAGGNGNGLSQAEIQLCSVLRLSLGQYRDSKRRILAAAARKYKLGKDKVFRKTDAQKACRIDVNKASRLYCAFSAAGWLEPSIFEH